MLCVLLAPACADPPGAVPPQPSASAPAALAPATAAPAVAAPATSAKAAGPSQDNPCATAPDPKACMAAMREPEGDESLVALVGAFRIKAHFFPGVSALGATEAAAFHGRDVRIEPKLTTPWETCQATAWSHRPTTLAAWLSDHKATLAPAKLQALGVSEPLRAWEARCSLKGGSTATIEVLQVANGGLVLMHEGVGFVLERAR